jgi:hypothetical protein
MNAEKSNSRSTIAYKINYPLFKLVEFDAEPTNAVIFGDSRSNKLDPNYFSFLLNDKVTNLSFGGGTLPEIIDAFWQISQAAKLNHVFIGVNFNLFSSNNNLNRVAEAVKIKNSYLVYLTCRYTMKATYYICKSALSGKSIEIEQPPFSKEDFWNYQLEVAAANFYRSYNYPQEFVEELEKISEYCRKNSINLTFFIPPTHIDLQERIAHYDLIMEEIRFKKALRSLGDLCDFDYPNELTEDKSNFIDPFHCVDSIARLVVFDIVSGKETISKYYNLDEK